MVEKHLKGKDASKILNAFQNALTPADYNQLAITGRYINGNKTSEQLTTDVISNYSDNITKASGKIQAISLELEKQNSKNNRIASTIRHNRARGKHTIDAMSEIIIELKKVIIS
jgi:hypothetical protein